MKGGPGKGRDFLAQTARDRIAEASMKGGPGKGRDIRARLGEELPRGASMKGGPGKGRDAFETVFRNGGFGVPR